MRKIFFIKSLAGGFLLFFAAGLSALPRTIQLFDSTRLAGNSIVEIVADAQWVWLATERGISYTTDNGVTWQNFDRDETGDLLSNEIAALGVRNDTLWAATSFTRVFGNQNEGFQSVPFGTGFAVTGNRGATWTRFAPDQDSGAGTLAFDLSFSDSAVWAASFFGGLVRSTDGGATWINAFADSLAKFDFETQSFLNRNNRFFSVAADKRSGDTIVVWAGSAAGLNKFIYLPRRLELADNRIFDIAFDGSRHWFGTADGLSYTPDTGKSFVSLDKTFFPGGDAVSALYADGGQILAGFTDDDSLRNGAGLYRSTNGGTSWQLTNPSFVGTGQVVRQIVKVDNILYAACDRAGLMYSTDGGQNWQSVFLASTRVDSSSILKRQQFISIAPFKPTADSLILLGGARFGLATMIFPNFTTRPDSFASIAYTFSDTNTFAGNRIEKVAVDSFKNSILTYWVIAHPDAFPESYSVNRSTDRGTSWVNRFAAIPAYEIAFQDSALWLGVFDSLLFSGDNGLTFKSVLVRDTVTRLSLARRSVRALLTGSNSIWAGTTNGAAFTISDSGQNWAVFRTEKEEAHKVQRYFFPVLPGNFGVVLGVQKSGTNKAVWVGAHTTDIAGERSGVARSTDDGTTWIPYFLDTLAWNFAFWGDTVWVATSSGLFRSPDMGQNWQPVPIAGVDAYSGAVTSFSSPVEILSVRQINDSTVWAGSTDGAAVSFDWGQNWRIFRRFLSTGTGPGTAGAEIYASPVPFSPNRGLGVCRFHYRPSVSANVTIEIFDFAMRRVKTVIQDAPRSAGFQYDTDSWDGKNEKGDLAANGTYFFRIDFGGEKKWGKLVVLK